MRLWSVVLSLVNHLGPSGFQFNDALYHLQSVVTGDPFWEDHTEITLNGEIADVQGGTIIVKSLNTKFEDTIAYFSKFYKFEEGDRNWASNISVTFTKTSVSQAYNGRGMFLMEPSEISLSQMVFYKGMQTMGFWKAG